VCVVGACREVVRVVRVVVSVMGEVRNVSLRRRWNGQVVKVVGILNRSGRSASTAVRADEDDAPFLPVHARQPQPRASV
jgi:hypothetical protein